MFSLSLPPFPGSNKPNRGHAILCAALPTFPLYTYSSPAGWITISFRLNWHCFFLSARQHLGSPSSLPGRKFLRQQQFHVQSGARTSQTEMPGKDTIERGSLLPSPYAANRYTIARGCLGIVTHLTGVIVCTHAARLPAGASNARETLAPHAASSLLPAL